MKFRNLNNGAFDNFDADNFDPDTETTSLQVASAKPGQKLQLNITLANPTAEDLTFEMFNYLNSCTRVKNANYLVGNWKYIPLLSHQGLAAVIATTGGTVGFDQDGSLAITGDLSPVDLIGTISCGEMAYAALFEASAVIPFTVLYLRYTANTDAQFDNNLEYFSKSFDGGEQKNTISPRAYFRPNQFQAKTIDITVNFTIGIDRGLRTVVLAGENVRLAMFIQLWTA